MNVPNWKHHSNKIKKPKKKPQAIRSSKDRLRALLNQLYS